MKRIPAPLHTVATFMAILSLSACDAIKGNAPKQALRSYLDAVTDGRYEESYALLSHEDRSAVTFEEYRAMEKELPFVADAEIRKKARITITDVAVSGNTATARVTATVPDVDRMVAKIFGEALAIALSGKGSVDEKAAESLPDKIPMKTLSLQYRLVKENGKWKVRRGYKAKKLVREADELLKKKDIARAIDLYKQALAYDSELVEAQKGLKTATEKAKEIAEKQAYIKKVKLYDFVARYFTNLADERVPGVRFKLKNEGQKTLGRVVVIVYFKDKNGTIIAEEEYVPVNENALFDGKPLRPGYIWQLERNKFYVAPSVPSEWQEGAAIAKIADIEFSDSP